jgi:hypothetical protein
VRGEQTREVTGRCRVESINGDGSLKLKRERHRRGSDSASSSRGASTTRGARSAATMAKWAAAERKSAVMRYQEEVGYERGGDGTGHHYGKRRG